MYNPPRYLTVEVLAAILGEFEWPATYSLEDWDPDGVGVVFPRCTLAFEEGFESEMQVRFVEVHGLDRPVTLTEVTVALGGLNTPGLINYFSPAASLDKVKNGTRDLCRILLTHFRSTLLGDPGWLDKVRK
jgi:hypothetical protein